MLEHSSLPQLTLLQVCVVLLSSKLFQTWFVHERLNDHTRLVKQVEKVFLIVLFFSLCFSVTNGSSHMEEVEDGELYRRGLELNSSTLHSYLQDRFVVV